MKKTKILVYCNCCGCRLKEQKAHLDRDGYYYCASCFNKLLQIRNPVKLTFTHKATKAERKYRRKHRRH